MDRGKEMKKTRCIRCNRQLLNYESIQRKYGYVCYRKMKDEEAQKEFERNQMTIYDFIH